jgi:hypothetical protein
VAAVRRPLVCASLHGPSSRPAMAAAAIASELEQEVGRAPPPQIRSRPAGAAPERVSPATAGAGQGKDGQPHAQGREAAPASPPPGATRRRQHLGPHAPPAREGEGAPRGALGRHCHEPQLRAPPPWPHALPAREGEGAPRARARAMATVSSSKRRRTCADPAAGAMAPHPAGMGGSGRPGGERENGLGEGAGLKKRVKKNKGESGRRPTYGPHM